MIDKSQQFKKNTHTEGEREREADKESKSAATVKGQEEHV
ncbi:hypothetical protein BDE02_18G010400 [Populus trichocarpa]|jgi:hypothetical protein|nr:hypothetical protein BDE02_18G010400 [Populus trichocarpa]